MSYRKSAKIEQGIDYGSTKVWFHFFLKEIIINSTLTNLIFYPILLISITFYNYYTLLYLFLVLSFLSCLYTIYIISKRKKIWNIFCQIKKTSEDKAYCFYKANEVELKDICKEFG